MSSLGWIGGSLQAPLFNSATDRVVHWASTCFGQRTTLLFRVALIFVVAGNLRLLVSPATHQYSVGGVGSSSLEEPTMLVETQDDSSNTIAFPRWEDSKIEWSALESYIRYADRNLDKGNDLMCRTGGCPTDMPNVIYIFGGPRDAGLEYRNNDNSKKKPHMSNNSTLAVWVEGRRRKYVGPGFQKRYPIVEELLDRALQYLLSNVTSLSSTLYPNLTRQVQQSHDKNMGIPLLLNLGDNRQCHHHNLPVLNESGKTRHYSVPVLTLAVPAHCGYALPIPHPAALDTAKIYGPRWDAVFERRRRTYPHSRQLLQAVWRGSPTGAKTKEGSARYQMVVAATSKTAKQSNHFDVGFGKPLHKLFPNVPAENIAPAKSKLWFEDFAKYRIALDADGSSWSERFGLLLCLNSVVAKVDPEFVDWWWPEVQEGIHYVKIARDASNLQSVVRRILEEEDTDATQARIAQANDWCRQRITYPRMVHDVLDTLEAYVSLLDAGDPDWPLHWRKLLTQHMPAKHHHWKALPVQRPKPYFPLWRDGIEVAT